MGKTEKIDKRALILFGVCLAVILVLINLLFIRYRRGLDQNFYTLEEQLLDSFIGGQRDAAEAKLTDLQNNLKATAALIEQTGVDPDSPGLIDYLKEMGEIHSGYQVQYIPLETLAAGLEEQGIQPSDYENYQKLAAGQSVVSELRRSKRLNGTYFSIAEPVLQDGKTIGVLRSLLDAELLLKDTQSSTLYAISFQCVTDSSGTVLYTPNRQDWVGADLVSGLSERGMKDAVSKRLRAALGSADATTILIGEGDGETHFVSSVGLKYNNWHLVKIETTTVLDEASREIMHRMIWISGSLMLLTFLVGLLLLAGVLRQQRKQKIEHARYAAIANFTDTVLFEYNYKEDILEMTDNGHGLFSSVGDRIRNLRAHRFDLLGEKDRARFLAMLDEAAKSAAPRSIELCFADPSSVRWYECKAQALGGKPGSPEILIGKMTDITARKSKELLLIERAERDQLTGLLNKVSTEQAIRALLQQDGRGLLFMIDLNRFKKINDTYGHDAGDRALRAMSEALRAVFRACDPVGRIGGDEFLALMADADDETVAARKAEQIEKQLERISAAQGLEITASIGVACCPKNGSNYDALFKAADNAMYQAKKQDSGVVLSDEK